MAAATAAATGQSAKIDVRPLTHQEIHDHHLPEGTQVSGGIHTAGLGQPFYLDAIVSNGTGEVTGVAWEITEQPGTDALEPSPLGESLPIYEPKTREEYRLVERRMLRPTMEGRYSVKVTVTTAGGDLVATQDLTGGTYVGVSTCALCHSGGIGAENKVEPWLETGHATFFTEAIDGLKSSHYNSGCIQCHVVGYDLDPLAVNGGFDDVATEVGWTFPDELVEGNYDAMPTKLKKVANIQCENCHGAGSQHATAAVLHPELAKDLIHVNYNSGDCAQCHSEEPYHVYPLQWENSKHAVGYQRSGSCSECHQGVGFIQKSKGLSATGTSDSSPINCSTCHEPHDATNPHQIRTLEDVVLKDTSRPGGATVVSEGGYGKLCMQCHISRRDAVSYVESYHDHYGPHYGPQTDMLVGANAITYDKEIPSSAHYGVVEETCVTCHMQETARTSPEHLFAGGHTWNMEYDDGTTEIQLIAACKECHGEIESFDFKRQDYDGNGIVEGVQTEVKGLLSQLAIMLPPVGVPKPDHSPDNIEVDATWTKPQLAAAYNYLFVVEDGSWGVHNLSYAVGLLKASIADLSGDANKDCIADWWQEQYFGDDWMNNPDAAPDASPAGDGVPNWLKFSLNLDPHVPGAVVPDGVVWANGKSLGENPADDIDSVRIYTAAEIAFPTMLGGEYQIQSTSAISNGWQNVGDPIPGTGNVISYLTPTRTNVQQFYRVVETAAPQN